MEFTARVHCHSMPMVVVKACLFWFYVIFTFRANVGEAKMSYSSLMHTSKVFVIASVEEFILELSFLHSVEQIQVHTSALQRRK